MQPTLDTRITVCEYPKNEDAIMSQQWKDIFFLNWQCDADEIQKTLPQGLYVDRYNDQAYIAMVAFSVQNTQIKLVPFIPKVSNFSEITLQTYVYDESGLPGVWFYSIQANNFLVVQTASSIFNLPYVYAQIDACETQNNEIAYKSHRQNTDREFIFKKKTDPVNTDPESLAFFLTERYVIYSKLDELIKGRIHHTPYSLFQAEAIKWDERFIEKSGFKTFGKNPEHVYYSSGVNVEIFRLS